MPGKSRQGRRKQTARSKKRKGRRSPSSAVAQQQAVASTHEAAVRPEVSTLSASVPTSRATLTTVQHPHIVSELRRIGILAGVILVILVVIARVLS